MARDFWFQAFQSDLRFDGLHRVLELGEASVDVRLRLLRFERVELRFTVYCSPAKIRGASA